jgi:hypothetical protein
MACSGFWILCPSKAVAASVFILYYSKSEDMVCLTCVLIAVDKIVIAQAELSRFLNELYPGAYTSLTKVDYNALDSVPVRPIGVYGSKSEIVRFLRALNAIDAET